MKFFRRMYRKGCACYYFYEMVRDTRSLKSEISLFRDPGRHAQAKQQELLPYYERYISEVSRDYMAISLELSSLLAVFCDVNRPVTIADLGTGFSSFVLRRYARESGLNVGVWSVDDSTEWLGKTLEFLNRHGLDHENVLTWDNFVGQGHGGFDLILHDLGSMETRAKTLPYVLSLANPGGWVILDDVHITEYAPIAKKTVRESGLDLYSLRGFTRDKFGRFASLAVRGDNASSV